MSSPESLKPGQLFCPKHGVGYWPNQAWIHDGCVVNQSVVNNPVEPVVNKSRQVEWQQANRDRYNAKMREWMRAKRAKEK